VWAYLELKLGDFDSSRGLTWNFVQALVNCGSSYVSLNGEHASSGDSHGAHE